MSRGRRLAILVTGPSRALPNQNGRSRAWVVGDHFGMRKAIDKVLGVMVGMCSFGQVCDAGLVYWRNFDLPACASITRTMGKGSIALQMPNVTLGREMQVVYKVVANPPLDLGKRRCL
ncbi:hypothetical protein M440DRAFT_323828 [Trichoderma longibrachiatum ATCC 18648]|uniref:Uncharacterized protein n=1 Tax=Trichoderma longibrachiatum ATCC 18648 TaxID=983965 RepID=A0A2T4C1Q9_TRILO|nr:hypothetical protein M440DRAFT_323828 [Trichoderma longibrachiatum ATCC 18648]